MLTAAGCTVTDGDVQMDTVAVSLFLTLFGHEFVASTQYDVVAVSAGVV
jgi:hypothetical protein